MWFCIYLSDTVVPSGGAPIGVPGIQWPVEFIWHRKLNLHILGGRILSTDSEEDRAFANKESPNVFRVSRRTFFPVLKILTPAEAIACGLVDDPGAAASSEGPSHPSVDRAPAAAPDILPEEPPPSFPPPPPALVEMPQGLATPQARKRAQELGIDLTEVSGRTGPGGVISKVDVDVFWRSRANERGPEDGKAPGNLNLSQMMAATS